jgi:hypothetical protein
MPKNRLLSVIFLEKIAGIPNHCSFQHPQQLRFPSPKLIYSQFESHTNNLHFKKNLVRIGLPYQKLLNFDQKSKNFPLCAIWVLIFPIFLADNKLDLNNYPNKKKLSKNFRSIIGSSIIGSSRAMSNSKHKMLPLNRQ